MRETAVILSLFLFCWKAEAMPHRSLHWTDGALASVDPARHLLEVKKSGGAHELIFWDGLTRQWGGLQQRSPGTAVNPVLMHRGDHLMIASLRIGRQWLARKVIIKESASSTPARR